MTSILSSGNLVTLNVDASVNVPNTLSSSKIIKTLPLIISNENRKRKRTPAHLSRINLNLSARLCGSNESLNSGASLGSGSDDDCVLTPSLGNVDDVPIFSSSPDEYEKRLRLCPKLTTQLSTSSHSSTTSNVSVGTIRNVLSSSSLQNIIVSANNAVSVDVDECYDFAELECSQGGSSGSTSVKSLAFGGLVIGDGEFEIVGDGRECKAVNIGTQIVYHCQVLKAEEYKNFLNVVGRLKAAEILCDPDEYAHFRSLIIPDETRSIPGDNGMWYIIFPDHFGNLHSLVQTNCNNFSSLSAQDSVRLFSERRIHPIFKQIVALVDFCHKIGIFFRDFRLRKFVFIDRERTQIRLNNVLEMWVAPEIDNDIMSQRHVCPAYVAPEILDVKKYVYYAGKAADVWALGVLMFILLTGRYPFYEANPNPMALFKRIRARRFSFQVNEYISASARWLLHGILRLNPKERPTAAEILQSHWLQADACTLPDGLENALVIPKSAANVQNNNLSGNFDTTGNSSSASSNSRNLGITDYFFDYFS